MRTYRERGTGASREEAERSRCVGCDPHAERRDTRGPEGPAWGARPQRRTGVWVRVFGHGRGGMSQSEECLGQPEQRCVTPGLFRCLRFCRPTGAVLGGRGRWFGLGGAAAGRSCRCLPGFRTRLAASPGDVHTLKTLPVISLSNTSLPPPYFLLLLGRKVPACLISNTSVARVPVLHPEASRLRSGVGSCL